MKLRVVLLAGAALLLTGCFDGHYTVGLNNDGSGTVAVELVLDKDLSRDILKDKKGKLDQGASQAPLGKNARSSQRVENGAIVVSQVLDFKSLQEITGGGVNIEVQNLGRSMLGMARSRIRFANTTNQDHHKKAADNVGDRLVEQMFKGHEMRVTMHLPCSVEAAESVSRDGVVYAPTVSKTWFNGSTVEWRVPMAVMIKMDAQGGPHDFVATCWSFSGITPGKSHTG